MIQLSDQLSPVTGWRSIRHWPARRWVVAVLAGIAVTLAIGLPTDVIPNPVFSRPVPVTWWSPPVLVITAVLSGLLAATYVRAESAEPSGSDGATAEVLDRPGRLGSLASIGSLFAVGCPVCNKVVIIALGTTGARQWFEPIQPALAVASIGLIAVALHLRLRSASACAV